KGRNIILDHLIRIRLAHPGAHLRKNPFLTDGAWTCVLHLDRPDDGRCRGSLRRLRPRDRGTKEGANESAPDCKRRGAHPSRKKFHRLRSAAPRKRAHAGQAAISERRCQSSRPDFFAEGSPFWP